MSTIHARLAALASILLIWSAQPASGQATGATASAPASLTLEQAAALGNPVPFNSASIAAGKTLYLLNNCAACHGADGKALLDIVAENATDLTDPRFWNNGTAPGQIFRSLRDGSGPKMPAFGSKLKDEELWRLVNFIQNLWPAENQPARQP